MSMPCDPAQYKLGNHEVCWVIRDDGFVSKALCLQKKYCNSILVSATVLLEQEDMPGGRQIEVTELYTSETSAFAEARNRMKQRVEKSDDAARTADWEARQVKREAKLFNKLCDAAMEKCRV